MFAKSETPMLVRAIFDASVEIDSTDSTNVVDLITPPILSPEGIYIGGIVAMCDEACTVRLWRHNGSGYFELGSTGVSADTCTDILTGVGVPQLKNINGINLPDDFKIAVSVETALTTGTLHVSTINAGLYGG